VQAGAEVKRALQLAEEASAKLPDALQPLLTLASAYLRDGQLRRARNLLERAVKARCLGQARRGNASKDLKGARSGAEEAEPARRRRAHAVAEAAHLIEALTRHRPERRRRRVLLDFLPARRRRQHDVDARMTEREAISTRPESSAPRPPRP